MSEIKHKDVTISTETDGKTTAHSSAQARGRRLKSLRKMADLSRKYLTVQHSISSSTLQSWEEGKAGGLTVKGAQKVISALREEGVYSTAEWLLYGTGQPPHLSDKTYLGMKEPLLNLPLSGGAVEASIIAKELETFRQLNDDVLDMIVADNGMHPIYKKGDTIAGKRYFGKEVAKTVGRDCIVETKTGEILCRRLLKGKKDHLYCLQCIHLETTVDKPYLYDIEVLSAAPILWHRKPE